MKRPGRPRKYSCVELPTSKTCKVCNAVFYKSKNESYAAWHDRVVCSVRCVHRSNRGPRGIFDHERFIVVWNGSSSAQEVAQQLGITRETASGRARELRKSGRAVKFMRTEKTTRSRNVAGVMMSIREVAKMLGVTRHRAVYLTRKGGPLDVEPTSADASTTQGDSK